MVQDPSRAEPVATNIVTSFTEALPFLQDLPWFIVYPTLMAIGATAIIGFISVFGLVAVWLERKIAAHIQCRLGPMEVGKHGALQTLADGLKLIAKEDIIPREADKPLFILAPIIAFTGVFLLFVAVPFDRELIIADLNIGILYLAAIGSVEVIGIIMSGWASNNKWSLFGAMRAAAQVVSYELPLGLALIAPVLLAGSLSTIDIVEAQRGWFWNWFLFSNPFMPVAFIIYVVASLAECKRAPFDLPEAESELVSGFHTEYSGMRFSIFFIAEYAAMYVVSAIAAVAFLGGYYTGIPFLDELPGVWGVAVRTTAIMGKALLLVCFQIWLRWTIPRIRLDQMFHLCYKVLLPFAFAAVLGATIWQLVLPDRSLWFFTRSSSSAVTETAALAPEGTEENVVIATPPSGE